MRRLGRIGAAVAWAGALGALASACGGSARTALPAPSPTAAAQVAQSAQAALPPGSAQAPTTASPYKTAGERFPLEGGTITALYPRMQWRPPKDAPLPDGQRWFLLPVEVCAAKDRPLPAALVQASRFRLEVPGQGVVAPAPSVPASLAKGGLAVAADLAPGSCAEGTVTFVVGGEGHVESVLYDTGAGPLRWAS